MQPRLRLTAAVAAATLAVDQLTKWWAVAALDDRTIDLVWTLRLNLVRNFESAFSLWGPGPWLSILPIIVVVVLLRIGRGFRSRPTLVAMGLVLGGALGNLTDRALRDGSGFLAGGVIDFVDLQWWPVFNVADIAVVIGGGLLVLFGGREVEART